MPWSDEAAVKLNEIIVLWEWPDGVRCVLCEGSGDELELRVFRGGRTIRRESVADLLVALDRTAPALEIELLSARSQPAT